MIKHKIHFSVGLIAGLLLAGTFAMYFAPRYQLISSGEMLIKQDRWTGNTWRFEDGEWEKINDPNRNWQKVDQALREALNISKSGTDADSSLNMLKAKFPVLMGIPNDELLGRIKYFYSQQILTDMYLKNFTSLHEDTAKKQNCNEPN